MANEKQMEEVFSRVKSEIMRELEVNDSRFEVGQLVSSVGSFAGGADAAWEISYKTTSLTMPELAGNPVLGRSAAAAWEISYKTNKIALDAERVVGRK